MPKSRRKSAKSKNKSLWAKIAGLFVVMFVVAWMFIPKNTGVLGESTSKLMGIRPSVTPGKCKPMLSAISFSDPCMGQGEMPGFRTVTYKCADGTTGTSSTKCLQPQQALEAAGKTCSKGSNCARPSGVRPSEEQRPSGFKTGSTSIRQ